MGGLLGIELRQQKLQKKLGLSGSLGEGSKDSSARLEVLSCLIRGRHGATVDRSCCPDVGYHPKGGLATGVTAIYLVVRAFGEEKRCKRREKRVLDPYGTHGYTCRFWLGSSVCNPRSLCMRLPTQ